MVGDLKFLTFQFDSSCKYLDSGINKCKYPSDYIPNLRDYGKKIIPFVIFIRRKLNTIIIQPMKF